jgi:hypothetical protein
MVEFSLFVIFFSWYWGERGIIVYTVWSLELFFFFPSIILLPYLQVDSNHLNVNLVEVTASATQ